MKKLIYGILVAVCFSLSGLSAHADEITLIPADMHTACDGCVGPFDGVFDTLTGEPAVGVALWTTYDPPFGMPFEERGAVEFNISGLKNSDVTSANLMLNIVLFSGYMLPNQPIIQIYGYVGDGTIGLDDMYASNLLYTSPLLSTLGPLPPIDVTPFIRSMVAEGHPFAGFLVRDIAPQSGVLFNFKDDVPKLPVIATAIPEPSSLALLVIGLAALSWKLSSKLVRTSGARPPR